VGTIVRTRYGRARQAVEARQRVIPLGAAFFLGFATARVYYPLVRHALVRGALAPLKLAVLEARRPPKVCCDAGTGPVDWSWALVTVLSTVVLVSWIVEEQRRRSVTKGQFRNRLYRIGLVAFTASLVVPWLQMGDVGHTLARLLAGAAGCAVVAAAWRSWRRGTRLEAMALFVGGSGLAILLGHFIDSLVLKG
jgi:hypothetical protein